MLMLCPICATEFQAGLWSCPECDCDLVPSTISETADQSASKRIEFIELCRPRSFPIAMLIKQILEQHSVVALVKGGHSLSILPHLAIVGELRILVDRDRLDLAQEIYRAYFESDDQEFLPEE